eukprot:gnl/TRDRNA2_/TRDRNA2_170590_c3_seq1.p2 gnl/TRDRNA2_/TRDRNA2_170590_c3~~gnl/TRDRNA2_/TRDRNA2_170590_c3_seq1.p2  ORF type:complete len:104 (-),score=1.01 gnl/TRDRNA2_/TRDRNA2_170590_c3_seq1:137-448(-)
MLSKCIYPVHNHIARVALAAPLWPVASGMVSNKGRKITLRVPCRQIDQNRTFCVTNIFEKGRPATTRVFGEHQRRELGIECHAELQLTHITVRVQMFFIATVL